MNFSSSDLYSLDKSYRLSLRGLLERLDLVLLERRLMRQIVPICLITAELKTLSARTTTLHLAAHNTPKHQKTIFPSRRAQTWVKMMTLLERPPWYHTRVNKERSLARDPKRELLSNLLLTGRNLKARSAEVYQCWIVCLRKMSSPWSTHSWKRLVLITLEWVMPRLRQFSGRQWRESTAWSKMMRLPLSLRATRSASSFSTDKL